MVAITSERNEKELFACVNSIIEKQIFVCFFDGWAAEMGSQEKKDTRPVGKTPCSLKTEIVHPKTRNALHHVGDHNNMNGHFVLLSW